MSSIRFILNGASSNPVYGNEFNYGWEKAEDSFYFRKKVNSKLVFTGPDFEYIESTDIEDKFSLVIEKYKNGTWAVDYVGYFFKTDCEFEHDDKTVNVKPTTDDGYEDVKKVLNNEYSFVDLEAAVTTVNYRIRPIMQVVYVYVELVIDPIPIPVFSKSDNLTNVVGLSYWEETLDKEYNPDELIAAGFKGVAIADLPGIGLYIYTRYLTTLDTFNGVATSDRAENDLSAVSSYYSKTSSEVYIEERRDTTSTTISKYGKAIVCGLDDEYWIDLNTVPNNTGVYIPCGTSVVWGSYETSLGTFCQSLWVYQKPDNNDYELLNSETIELLDSYYMPDMLQKILEQETDIVHQDDPVYSEFFYDSVDPIGQQEINLFFTPKSNIVNSYYTVPAKKSRIRLSEMLRLFLAEFEVYWHIEEVDGEKRLRLEHISWYENGGTYSNQEISVDLTTTYDKRNGKPLSYYQNKYNYVKEKMPQRYEFAYDNEANDYFNGAPIEVVSSQIENGVIEKRNTESFSPDIDSVVGRDNASLEGWSVLAAEYSDSTYTVGLKSIKLFDTSLGGTYFNIQNGLLSYLYLHPTYQRYGKPAENLNINGEDTTALSIARNKQQVVTFPYDQDIDPLNLIRTELGAGQVDKMEQNIVSDEYKVTINQDTN